MKNLVKIARDEWLNFCKEWNVSDYPQFDDVCAIISAESSWNPVAESRYARGLMQVSQTALETINKLYNTSWTYDDLLNPAINVRVGMLYMRYLWRHLSKLKLKEPQILVVMAYNWGIGNLQRWLEVKPDNRVIDEAVPEETKNYVISYLYWKNWWAGKDGKI